MIAATIKGLLKSFVIGIAIYPLVLIGVWALLYLGTIATEMHMPTDMTPLIYGLVFAVLTVALIDILGVASVVLALVASANLIEYAQLLVPGRTASPIDFIAGLGGVIFAATLVWTARVLVDRHSSDPA